MNVKKVDLPNDETIAYRERPGGDELLILVHGNMSSSLHWDLLMEDMDTKYTIYAIDLRGFGESSYRTPIDSLSDFSHDLKLFVDTLDLKKFNLMGWSTGGGVIMQFTADYPDYVKRLVLMESVGTRGYPIFKKDEKGKPILTELLTSREEIANDPVQVLPILNAYSNKDSDTMKLIWNSLIYDRKMPNAERYDRYVDEMFKQRNLIDVDYALANFNISQEDNGINVGSGVAGKISAPTLILWGKEDKVVPEKMAIDIKNDIGNNAKLVYLENSGHSPLTDDLDQIIEVLSQFLNE